MHIIHMLIEKHLIMENLNQKIGKVMKFPIILIPKIFHVKSL